MNVEQWASIDDYDNYEVSNFGNIRNSKTMKILKPGICGQGHMKVSLCKNGKGKTHGVHVLVAKGFVENPHNKKLVGHIDKNLKNNHFENLRWMTSEENARTRCLRSDNTTGYKGVEYDESENKYTANITNRGICYSLGYFDSAEEAARAYDKRAREIDPVFFTLNFND